MLRSLALALLLGQAWSLHARTEPRPSSASAPPLLSAGDPYDFADTYRDAAAMGIGAESSLISKPQAARHFFSPKDCVGGLFVSQEACVASRKKPVYLASYPCSGNTWTRSMLEEILLIHSGSIFADGALRAAGFQGEGTADPTQVFPIKTHWPVIGNHTEDTGLKHLVIMRHPLHAALSWCHLEHGDFHNAELPKEKLAAVFEKNIEHNLREWTSMAYTFRHRSDVHFVRYEDIVRNASHVYRTDILPYLGVNPDHPNVTKRIQNTIKRSDAAYQTSRRKHTYTFKFSDRHKQFAREIIGEDLARYYGYCLHGGLGNCPGEHKHSTPKKQGSRAVPGQPPAKVQAHNMPLASEPPGARTAVAGEPPK